MRSAFILALMLAAFAPWACAQQARETGQPAATSRPVPAPAPAPSGPPVTFVPSEKISADSSVSFPVDI